MGLSPGTAPTGDRGYRAAKTNEFRGRALSSHEEERLVGLITARPDATLAELQHALPTRAALSTLWRTIDRLGLTVKKNRTRRRAASA